MRSPILQEILDNTPESVDKYVDLYADCIVFKGQIKRKIESLKNKKTFTDYELGRLDTLEIIIRNFEEIIKL